MSSKTELNLSKPKTEIKNPNPREVESNTEFGSNNGTIWYTNGVKTEVEDKDTKTASVLLQN